MEESKEPILCWHCNQPLSSLTNPQFNHQLCTDCKDDGLIIVLCLKCGQELLTHKHRGNRVCEKCHGNNRHISPIAQGIGWH